jgi:hypothetical protein
MKRLLQILLLLVCVTTAFAQEVDPDDDAQIDPKAKEKITTLRIAYINERLGLTPEEAEKFWPVYHEFVQKRQNLKKELRQERKKGTDEKTLLDLEFKLKQQELDLEKDYSGRLQKVVSAQKLITLRQAEGDFRRMLIRQIQQRQLRQERRETIRQRRNN